MGKIKDDKGTLLWWSQKYLDFLQEQQEQEQQKCLS